MNEERIAILKMLEEGKITVKDATALLEAIDEPAPSDRLQVTQLAPSDQKDAPASRSGIGKRAQGRDRSRKTPRVRGRDHGQRRERGRNQKRIG